MKLQLNRLPTFSSILGQCARSVRATRQERTRALPGDELIEQPIGSLHHAITIRRPRHEVWPWLAQMGAGSRAGWYSYDFLDNGRRPSATRIVPELQPLAVGMIFPAGPGVTDGFTLLAFDVERFLVLGWTAPDGGHVMTWAFVLEDAEHDSTRLLVRVRVRPGARIFGLPWSVTNYLVSAIHFVMQRQQLIGIARRAEDPVTAVRVSSHSRMPRKGLLIACVASVVVYGLGDLVSGLLYNGYSYKDQWISELTAFGSPVRPLMVAAILAHGLLLLVFGVGLWRYADRRSLRWVGVLLTLAGVIGFPTHTVFAMSSRWMTAGFNDTMHAMLSLTFVLIVFAAVVLSAVAFPGWFRLYAIATIPVLGGFGAASSIAIQGLAQNATPWAGAFERINAYAYFAWLIVLAVIVTRRSLHRGRRHADRETADQRAAFVAHIVQARSRRVHA